MDDQAEREDIGGGECPTPILDWRRLSEDQVSYFQVYTSMSGSRETELLPPLFRTYGHMVYEISPHPGHL